MKHVMTVIIVVLFSLASLFCLYGIRSAGSNGLMEDVFSVEKSDSKQEDSANSWRYSNGKLIEKQNSELKRASAYNANATRKGIDVSGWQGQINWEKVKASGIDFAILRCGYGGNYISQDDKYFERNASECERLGIPYGVYLYSYATDTTRAASEADHTLRLIQGHTLAYPVYYDMEDNSTIGSDYAAIAKTYCNKVAKSGYPVGVYANLNWWNKYLTDSCFDQWHRWVAQYNSSCQYKGNYAIWQYTSSGAVNGISGRVDMNFLIGYPKDHGENRVAIAEKTYTISNKNDETKILGVVDSNGKDNAKLGLSEKGSVKSCNRFEIISTGNKQYKILSEHAGKVLSVEGNDSASGTSVVQCGWNQSSGQTWEFVNAGNGYYYLRSGCGTYLKLSDEQELVSAAFSKEDAQQWKLSVSEYRPVEDGIYTIENQGDSSKSIGINQMDTADKANIGLEPFSGNISQQFRIQYKGDGYYQIVAEHSEKAWDVAGGSKADGANLQQYRGNGSNAQQWKFVENGDGSYTIKSRLGTSVAGTDTSNVVLASMNPENLNQRWRLNKVDSHNIKDGIYTIRSSDDSVSAITQRSEKLQINDFNNMLEQKCKIEFLSNGYYKITDIATGKVFDVQNGSTAVGARVQIHDWNGTDAQLWRFMRVGENTYAIKSKSGRFIQVNSLNPTEGLPLLMGEFDKHKCLEWDLRTDQIAYSDQRTSGSDQNLNRLFSGKVQFRLGGSDRYKTALLVAGAMKQSYGRKNFPAMIVACGTDYPDALAGSYLAKRKEAPILLVDGSHENEIIKYINSNLAPQGIVYLLGGDAVISSKFEKTLMKNVTVKRLAGKNRYETNMKILTESGIDTDSLILCSGNGFADSLSVSASGLPILLVNDKLDDAQKRLIHSAEIQEFFLIGGSGVVNKRIESECHAMGNIVRLAGWSRYTTSVAVAYGFFGTESNSAVLTSGGDFPDGLSGGPVAASISAPMLLTGNKTYDSSAAYAVAANLNKILVLGGEEVINNSIAQKHVR